MLTIWGIEATQATQFFQSPYPLCPGSGTTKVPCSDNSIPMVGGKPTILRLYVSGANPGDHLAGVATRPENTPFGVQATTIGFGGMTATSKPSTRLDPTTTIQIPLRPQQPGTYRFDILAINYGPNWTGLPAVATSSILLEFVERRRVRIRLVRIHYTGRGLDVAPPTQQDFWDATDFAQHVLPIPSLGFEIVKDSIELYDGDFTRIDPSAHDMTWSGFAANRGTTGNLLNIMDSLVATESLPGDVIYIGMYPDNVNQAPNTGWAVGQWIISDRSGSTLAHEVLHHVGSPQHAPCGGAPNLDPNYPDYLSFSPFPAGSIGEVGFNFSSMAVYDPQNTFDLMSYCSPKWISPFNYQRSFNTLVPLPPEQHTPPPFHLAVVDLAFARFPDRYAIVDLPGFRRPAPPWPPGPQSEFQVHLFDESGASLYRVPVSVSRSEDPRIDVELVYARLPWIPAAAAVALCREGEVLVRKRLLPAPELEVHFPPRKQLEACSGEVRFRVRAESHEVAVAVRVSLNGGSTWNAIATHGAEGSVDAASLLSGAGDHCLLQVVASTGYHTAERTSEPFHLRLRERPILAWSSAKNGRADRNHPVQLFAISRGGAASAEELSWYSDFDGDLGQGARLSTWLRPGRHRVEVRSRYPFESPAHLEIEVE